MCQSGFQLTLSAQYAVRHARSALARLHTDRNLVNERLAPALEAAFQREAGSAETRAIAPLSTSLNGAQPLANGHDAAARARGEEIAMEAVPDAPVAKVNSVAPGSPAADAVSQSRSLGRSDADC
jgi:hypothetical protein